MKCFYRCHIKDCHQVAEKASDLIHSALDDPDITLSENELRWLGCNVYNLGCVCYQRDCFLEGVPLLTIACNELKVWCFASKTEEEILERIKEVILRSTSSLISIDMSVIFMQHNKLACWMVVL